MEMESASTPLATVREETGPLETWKEKWKATLTSSTPLSEAAMAVFSKSTPAVDPNSGPRWNESPESEAIDEVDESEEPPKHEVVAVIERCKVFGMAEGEYKDKGVGTLYIKPLSENKYQLVIRADNNLGTLLLNILLQKTLPLEKKSAKDVMTFDVMGNGGKGMPILLRVKSEDAANELLKQLQEFQRQSLN